MVLRNKKVLKLVVCMSLIAALAISALTLSARAIYENTYNNTGNQAQDIVGIAETQVGYYEGSNGYTKYGDWYGMPNADWCAMFVSWCADQAGVDSSVFQKFALCSAGADYFISQGNFHYSGNYIPQAGDLIFYASYGNIYHVGLVTGSDGYNVYSIEGNYNEAVSNVSYSLSYGDIMGYATPDYNVAGSTVVTDTDSDYEEPQTDSEFTDSIDDTDTSEDTDLYTDVDTDENTDVIEDTDSETEDSELDTDTAVESEPVDSETDSITDTESDTDSTEYELGDINGDGKVNLVDACLIQRHIVKLITLDDAEIARADMDASGELDSYDVIYLMMKTMNMTV